MCLLYWRMSCSLFCNRIWFYSQSGCLCVFACDRYLWLLLLIGSAKKDTLLKIRYFRDKTCSSYWTWHSWFFCHSWIHVEISEEQTLYSRVDDMVAVEAVTGLNRSRWAELNARQGLNLMQRVAYECDMVWECVSGNASHCVVVCTESAEAWNPLVSSLRGWPQVHHLTVHVHCSTERDVISTTVTATTPAWLTCCIIYLCDKSCENGSPHYANIDEPFSSKKLWGTL